MIIALHLTACEFFTIAIAEEHDGRLAAVVAVGAIRIPSVGAALIASGVDAITN